MRLSFSNERVLAVVAHPDDAELLCAGTLGRAKGDGAVVGVCVMCRGDKGQPAQPVEDLAAVRRGEAAEAAGVLGAELLTAAAPDGELMDTPAYRAETTELLRRFRPTLVLAHWGGDYHPDHRAASALAEAATWFAASPGQRTESAKLERPPRLWWMDTINGTGFTPGFYIDVGEHVETKQKMLNCHRSQIARGEQSGFAPLERLMLGQCERRGMEAGADAAEAFRPHHAWQRIGAW